MESKLNSTKSKWPPFFMAYTPFLTDKTFDVPAAGRWIWLYLYDKETKFGGREKDREIAYSVIGTDVGGLSKNTVARQIEKLVALGLLKIQKQGMYGNVYRVQQLETLHARYT